MPQKVTIFYNQAQAGFSETWYSPESTPPTSLSVAYQRLLRNAIEFRAQPTFIFGIKFSTVGSPRQTNTFRLGDSYLAPAAFTQYADVPPDVISTSAVYLLRSSDGIVRKRMWLRGLRDQDIQRNTDGTPKPSADLTKQVKEYFDSAKASGWTIQYLTQPPAAGLVWLNVSKIAADPNAGTQSILTLSAAPGFNLASPVFVRFTGVPHDDAPGFPNSAQVIAQSNVAPFSVTISYRLRAQFDVTPANMRMTKREWLYSPHDFIQFERFSRHDTGRPFGLLAGKSRAVVFRQ